MSLKAISVIKFMLLSTKIEATDKKETHLSLTTFR